MILLTMMALTMTAGRPDGRTAGDLLQSGVSLPSDRPTVRQAAETTDTTFAVAAGTRLRLETMNGEIVVKTWDRNQVRVQASHGRRDEVSIHRSGAVLSIEAEGPLGPPGHVAFDLTVPEWMALDLEILNGEIRVAGVRAAIAASNLSGDITVNGGAESITLESTAGSITLTGARGRIELGTTGGEIVARDLQGDLVVSTIAGSIILGEVDSKSVQVESVSGEVWFWGAIRDGGRYLLSSHSGDLYFGIPEGANAAVSVELFSGSVQSGITLPASEGGRRQRSFRFGNGSAAVALEAFSGSVHLERPGTIAARVGRKLKP